MSFFVYPEIMMEELIQVFLNMKYILIVYIVQKFQLQFEMPMVAWTENFGKFDWQLYRRIAEYIQYQMEF